MPKYMALFKLTEQGLKGTMSEGGSARRKAVETAVKSAGGTVEAYYFAFGDYDGVLIADFPDSVSAASVVMAACASGAVQTKTTLLITPEEMDQVTKKSVEYRPPGG